MSSWQKWLWGSIGWSLGGPIGAILAYSLASMTDGNKKKYQQYYQQKSTQAGDFGVTLLILFAKVMKADGRQSKSELEYIKQFFITQFGIAYAKERMQLFKEILKQEYSIKEVCYQIKLNMNHPTRLQLLHILFGLSQADGNIHPEELKIIYSIGNHLGIKQIDLKSIEAMFYNNIESAYKILETNPSSTDIEIKKAYRKMATKYHPDKIEHLGENFKKMAEDKFKKLNEAYQQIKKERGIK